MHAGTLGLLSEPADDALESWARTPDHPPALDVRDTQQTLDDRPVQTGYAAAKVGVSSRGVTVDGTEISTSSVDTVEVAHSGWVAEVTGSGIVVAESVAADDETCPFPFDLFASRTGSRCLRYSIDVNRLASAWADDDVITGVWMVASEDETGEGVTIDYGQNANLSDVDQASIGLGFVRGFQGSETKGVVFRGGYLSAYRDWVASKFVRFVEHEILPFAFEYEPEDEQVDFDEIFGGP